MAFLSWLEHSTLSSWARESPSLFAYSGILILHTLGLASVIGISTMIDLRLLGFARGLPLGPLEKYFAIVWTGVGANVVSGAILFAQDATEKAANPLFEVKMILVALAIVDLVFLRQVAFRNRREMSGLVRGLAWLSLALWLGVMIAGRLMAYVPVRGVGL